MLSTDKIVVSYRKNAVTNELNNVSLSIKPGELTAIVGPNGSGKSTLVKTLSRVLSPSAGVVLLDGSDLYTRISSRHSAQSISVAPQDTHVAFDFTSRDIISMGLSPYRSGLSAFSGDSPEESARIDAALTTMELGGSLADRPVMSLSGGERQRALIGRALIQKSTYVLLDEPTASLDLLHQVSLFRQLKDLVRNEGRAVVVVLHDLNLAASHADRLVVLSEGRVVADGSPEEILTPSLIESVYRTGAIVTRDIATGRPIVNILPVRDPGNSLSGSSFFVFGGAGGAGTLFRQLVLSGAKVTAGFLQDGDTDQLFARAFGINYYACPALEQLPNLSEHELRRIADTADAIIFCPSAVGEVNAAQLTDVLTVARSHKKIFIVKRLVESIMTRGTLTAQIVLQELLDVSSVREFESFSDLMTIFYGDNDARTPRGGDSPPRR